MVSLLGKHFIGNITNPTYKTLQNNMGKEYFADENK